MIRQHQAPNVTAELNSYTTRYADAWAHAHHEGDPRAAEWITLAVQTLRAERPDGARWFLNGKRGDANNVSWDIVAYQVDEAGGDARMVECYDVIGNAGTSNASITWNNVTNYNTIGGPGTAIGVAPPPLPGSGGVQPPAPVSDVWTARHDAIRARMAGRPAVQVAEQLAYTFPDEQWGEKRTSSGPWSGDTIGRLVGGRLWAIKLAPVTIYGLLEGHVHRQVQGVNHLRDVAPPAPPVEPPAPPNPPAPIEPPPAPVVDVQPFLDALATLRADMAAERAALVAELGAVKAQLAKGFDVTLYGRKVGSINPPKEK